MDTWKAEASNIRKTAHGLDADVLFTEDNGDVFNLTASIVNDHIAIGAEDDVMKYLNQRYTPQGFSLSVRNAIMSKTDS